jgi:hypothetical protein
VGEAAVGLREAEGSPEIARWETGSCKMQNQMHKPLELLQYDFPLHFAVAERVAALAADSLTGRRSRGRGGSMDASSSSITPFQRGRQEGRGLCTSVRTTQA